MSDNGPCNCDDSKALRKANNVLRNELADMAEALVMLAPPGSDDHLRLAAIVLRERGKHCDCGVCE